ncbi:serine/threonine-protein kinase [Ideonella sp. BN130291]|uniref:serine/threonine-protein kinase n=1 Tax=Ideonella sp. BN130291 TaxID=3112940 RepID=UPI002E26AE55|nr:serine/threonine-protein kinase [Ideonella sp. BN130291]
MSQAPPMLTDSLPFDAALPGHIGKYEVLRKLGEGATSEVFLARDNFHGRVVAIKRVRAAMLGGEIGDMPEGHYYERFFAAEAALVGRLQHPNVVQIFDAVADPVSPYLVMEYVQGITLRRFCRADALLSLEQIVEIGFKCAMALGYVYRQGLIHRDVKPANILAVVENDQVIDVKVTDFGSVLNLTSDRTQIFRVGSLAYMSPEQLDGSTLDARADIYSLAAVIYHLVAGRPPFDAQSQTALMNQIYNAEPPPLVNLRDGVPPRLDEVIRRALAKDPAERHTSWDEFAQALSSLVANREVPRGRIQGVLDSERFNLLRTLDFFSGFGDVELWEVVHRAKWQRFKFGHALFKRGQEGNSFHIIAQGEVEVFRDGTKVAQLGAGTSVGEMAYLAPSPELRRHSTDVLVSLPCTTICFTPDTLAQVSPSTRHLFDAAFIRVLVRRLHAAHEALAHPRRIL